MKSYQKCQRDDAVDYVQVVGGVAAPSLCPDLEQVLDHVEDGEAEYEMLKTNKKT